jgi:hypothetical protein
MRPTTLAALICLALGTTLAGVDSTPALESQGLEATKSQLLEEADALKNHIQADDVTAALESAQLIDAWLRQAQAQDVAAVFSEVSGWEMEIGESQAAGAGFFGGGVSTTCTWTKDEDSVTAHILSNSPMFATVSGMMGMAVASGKKVVKIHGNKAILDEGDGVDIQIPFQGNTLVSIGGQDLASATHIAENGINWDALKQTVEAQ